MLETFSGCNYGIIHIVITIHAEPAAENNISFLLGKFCVLPVKFAIVLIVYGIIRFVAPLPVCRIFVGNKGVRGIGSSLIFRLKVFMLNASGIRNIGCSVIENGNALSVCLLDLPGFETQGAVFQFAQTIIEIAVDGSGINDFISQLFQFLPAGEIVAVVPDLAIAEHIFDHFPLHYMDTHNVTDLVVSYMQEGAACEELAYGIKEVGENHYVAQVTKENGKVASKCEIKFVPL